jgi:hypothetical protein
MLCGHREQYTTKELVMIFNLFDPEVKKSSKGNKLNFYVTSQNR